MAKKTTAAIAHRDADLGKPAEYSRAQLALVKFLANLSIVDFSLKWFPRLAFQED